MEKENNIEKIHTGGFAKIISILTVAPIMAAVLVLSLYIFKNEAFKGQIIWLFLLLIALTVVPILAYPFAKIIPPFKQNGRDGQRKLAFIFALIGYIIGLAIALAVNPPEDIKLVFIGYFIVGVVLAFVNKVLKIKASGHACGVLGPITFMVYFLGPWALFALVVMPFVCYARLSMKRHTPTELIAGSIVGVGAAMLSLIIMGRLF